MPTLIFRVGNARGNDIVDASISLALVRDEVSPEGFHMKKMHDLELERRRSPLFALTWIVMHPITEGSPLHGVNWEAPHEHMDLIIATLLGHDGTFAQTVHARHTYYPEDIRPGQRFVDFTSELEDGRLMLDYSRFHDTEPEV